MNSNSIRTTNSDEETLRQMARETARGRTELTQAQIALGFDVTVADATTQRTLLHHLAEFGHTKLCDSVRRRGALASAKDKAGKTAGDLAEAKRHHALARDLHAAAALEEKAQDTSSTPANAIPETGKRRVIRIGVTTAAVVIV